MKVLTYADPFEINKNDELWSLVTEYPHFCASDTLLQGLEVKYKRESFGILSTVSNLIERVFGEFTKNPQNDVRLFLKVSEEIRKLELEDEHKDTISTFRFNIADVVESIKMLKLLNCEVDESDELDGRYLNEEQKTFLHIYNVVVNSDVAEVFESLKNVDKTVIYSAIQTAYYDEVEYLYKIHCEDTITIKSENDCIETLNKIEKNVTNSEIKKRIKHIRKLISKNATTYNKIIIHGVHRITPIMYYLFECLQREGIEVIFLINYAKNMPNLYKTWENVYSWTGVDFEYVEEVDFKDRKALAKVMYDVIEGKDETSELDFDDDENIVKIYNNLTEFADGEVRKCFSEADNSLNGMKTQYYAVNGTSSNEILKTYFPEHYEQKPFLSYPLGQFILGLYNMWDFEEQVLKINYRSLSECAVVNILEFESKVNMLDLINKIKLYFSDIENLEDIYDRIKTLKSSKDKVNNCQTYNGFKYISFFNVSAVELDEFEKFLAFLDNTAQTIFYNKGDVVFNQHYAELIKIMEDSISVNNAVLNVEKELLNEISKRLQKVSGDSVVGNIKDVEMALHLYLEERFLGTSNWIVRDFEQIDGAVLLSEKTKAETYNFSLLSNKNMTKQRDDVLPWPLDETMLNGYFNKNNTVQVITTGILERKNFLKYSLFYGVLFSKCKIQLSYLAEEDGDEQSMYYLLDAIGLKQEKATDKQRGFNRRPKVSNESGNFGSDKLEEEHASIFSICPYKFFMKYVLKEGISYYSDFHIRYFVLNYLTIKAGKVSSFDLNNEIKELEKLFPFWDSIAFEDIKKDFNRKKDDRKQYKSSGVLSYEEKKQIFLIAQWSIEDDKDQPVKLMKFNKYKNDKVVEYMNSDKLYPEPKDIPNKKVCQYCNFNDVCLLSNYANYDQMSDR